MIRAPMQKETFSEGIHEIKNLKEYTCEYERFRGYIIIYIYNSPTIFKPYYFNT